jgi:acyl-coenzyme A synthetase/AMP-(fatty) acid ligase
MAAEHEATVAKDRAAFYGFTPATVFHIANFGLWTAAGYKFPLAVWAAGGCVVIDQTSGLYRNFDKFGVTQAFLLPNMLEKLADSQPDGLPRTRFITSGGLMSQGVAKKVAARLSTRLLNIYTSTEVNRTILSAGFSGDAGDLRWLAEAEDAGIEIIDEAGRPADRDQIGTVRILLREQDCKAYRGDPETSARYFRDGYFYPGDSAIRRADGQIAILGRSDDVININGDKRAAGPLEQAFRDALNVRTVCIFSGADSAGDIRIVVALEADEAPPRALMHAAADSLGVGGSMTFTVLARFPYTDNGMMKIKRDELKKAIFMRLPPRQP